MGGSEDVMRACSEQPDVNSPPHHLNSTTEMELQPAQLANAFAELYDLLGQYAPAWYTQEQYDRTKRALGSPKKT
jgi:hypothetical protein